MTDKEQKAAAKQFADYWKDKGYEKGQSQTFWLTLLKDVYGIEHPEQFITFEEQVHLDHTSFIDGYINATKVMIEQKGLGKDLNKPIKQSDGSMLNPFQQAKRYITELPLSQHPRWVVTCNFAEFYVYDMERPMGEPEIIKLCDLPKEYYRLNFLVETGSEHIQREMEISLQAGELVGKLYNVLLKQYKDPTNEHSLKSLNMLCVRLVFCLYAEDAGIFGKHLMFHDYLKKFDVSDVRKALIELFKMLDTKDGDRDPYDETAVAQFPYVNGGLFADESIEIPNFNEEIVDLLINKASAEFDWSLISPTIFGAVFESTLRAKDRREGGMHYTSIENIHKVIDPLFLDDLRAELAEIKQLKQSKAISDRVTAFQEKLASLKFLDPACGSGNFLTETYISLRTLENEAIKLKNSNQIIMDMDGIIKVSISQFYGIEINDYAVAVAKTALWIAENQMLEKTMAIVNVNNDFLPLKSYANIVEGNSLRIDWESVVSKSELSYIMGNPPFIGYSLQTKEQKDDMLSIYVDEKGKPYKAAGKIDYVSAWYFKASELIQNTQIRCAFVSTNYITQGEQTALVWKPLFERFGVHIDFAWRTFKWGSESNDAAAVHCVIVGFSSAVSKKDKVLYEVGNKKNVSNINPYLIEADNVFIESRNKPICDVPAMSSGGKPVEGGHLIFTDEEYTQFIESEPKSKKYFRRFTGSDEYINNRMRWCLWLLDCSPKELREMPHVLERVEKVRKFRTESVKEATRKYANFPSRFMEIKQPNSQYIIVPSVSSEKRRYIPMGFLSPEIITSNLALFIPDATIYHFGILNSNVHMAWVRAVCGRLEMRYRYSNTVVYNNFPWCTPTDEQKAKIEQTAQAILDARALYPDCSLADLYDELTMPPELRTAHQNNDRAVMNAYGFDVKTMTESGCVAELMKMYQKLTDK